MFWAGVNIAEITEVKKTQAVIFIPQPTLYTQLT